MRRLGTVSSLFAVSALGAWLAGCPVWGPDNTGPRSCDRNTDCAANEYCDTATRTCVTTPTCGDGGTCPSGYFCDARNACVPGCSTNADCASRGAGLVCNTSTHQCEPGGCTRDQDCSNGELCVGNSCRPRTDVCQFNYQCEAGRECVDGRCLSTCASSGAATCPTGQVCVNNHCAYPTTGNCGSITCSANQICSSGVCLNTCSTDATCGAGNFCDHGVCRVDDRAHPFCTNDTMCATGSVCRNGACRIACAAPNNTNDYCQRRDVNFSVCGPDQICTNPSEQNPQCARTTDCQAGRLCVNATCR